MARRNSRRTVGGNSPFDAARKRVQRVLRTEKRNAVFDQKRREDFALAERYALLSDARHRLERIRSLRVHLDPVSPPGRAARIEAAPRVPLEPIKTEVDKGRQSRLSLRDDVVREHRKPVRDEISRDRLTCKERPKDGHKHRGGTGGSRPFIPWCRRH